jgi:hypothetical protein
MLTSEIVDVAMGYQACKHPERKSRPEMGWDFSVHSREGISEAIVAGE